MDFTHILLVSNTWQRNMFLPSESIVMSLDGTGDEHGNPAKYILKSASGLVPEEISKTLPNSSVYNFGALMPREVSFLVQLNPNYQEGETPSKLRDHLYKMIASPGATDVQIQFVNGLDFGDFGSGKKLGTMKGRVTKIDASIFSSDVEAQIVVFCEDPLIREPVATNLVPVDGVWGWDSHRGQDVLVVEDHDITAPSGIIISAKATEVQNNFKITQYAPNGEEYVFEITNGSFALTSTLYLSSFYNNFHAYRRIVSPGVDTSFPLVENMTKGSVWPAVYPGFNIFDFKTATDNFDFLEFKYYKSYWGV